MAYRPTPAVWVSAAHGRVAEEVPAEVAWTTRHDEVIVGVERAGRAKRDEYWSAIRGVLAHVALKCLPLDQARIACVDPGSAASEDGPRLGGVGNDGILVSIYGREKR